MRTVILYRWDFNNKQTLHYLEAFYKSLGYNVEIKDN